jgi:phosphoribosylpyrophosphate synthetase
MKFSLNGKLNIYKSKINLKKFINNEFNISTNKKIDKLLAFILKNN